MKRLIMEMDNENSGYFRGKELRYDNLAHYYQCVADPNCQNGFIAVQKRKKIAFEDASDESMMMDSESDEFDIDQQNESRDDGRIPNAASMEYLALQSNSLVED